MLVCESDKTQILQMYFILPLSYALVFIGKLTL